MFKKDKENTVILVLIILIIFAIVAIITIKMLNHNNQIIETNTSYTYECKQDQKDIQFALYDTYYYFDEKNGEIKNSFQVYNFMFKNLEYYNTIDQSALFKSNQPNDVIEDENNLIKSYYFNSPIPVDNNNSTSYIQLIEELGYTCEKTENTNEDS